MSATLTYEADLETLTVETVDRLPLGGPALKAIDGTLAQLRDQLGALQILLVVRQDRDFDYTCRLRDRREWIQRLYRDGRVDFTAIGGSWGKEEAELQLNAGAALIKLVTANGLLALSVLWTDPPPRDGEEAIEAETVP